MRLMNHEAPNTPLVAAVPGGVAEITDPIGSAVAMFQELHRRVGFVRLPTSVAMAIGINVLLLVFVIRLVTGERDRLSRETEDVTVVDFVRLIKDDTPVQRNRREEMPELVERIQPSPPEQKPREIEPPPEPQVKMITPDLTPPLNLTDAPALPAVTPPREVATPVEAPVAVQTAPAPPAQPAPVPAGAPGPATSGSDEPVFDSALVAISKPDPKYPPRALRSGTEGVVTVEFIVTPEGSVRDPKIVKADPPGIFDDAATQGVLRWKFKPKVVGGKAITRRARLDINFRLKK